MDMTSPAKDATAPNPMDLLAQIDLQALGKLSGRVAWL